ncbi:hypothetical protein HAX54_023688 [Datura stramonium]|uniref:Uncharacterized protein n=1 Tax=Datura stramonium TaxID=4076 RepID=A0ABS8UYR5_DATST|nr:hypothetical protein [Datura stramonium]
MPSRGIKFTIVGNCISFEWFGVEPEDHVMELKQMRAYWIIKLHSIVLISESHLKDFFGEEPKQQHSNAAAWIVQQHSNAAAWIVQQQPLPSPSFISHPDRAAPEPARESVVRRSSKSVVSFSRCRCRKQQIEQGSSDDQNRSEQIARSNSRCCQSRARERLAAAAASVEQPRSSPLLPPSSSPGPSLPPSRTTTCIDL